MATSTYNQQMRRLFDDYQQDGGTWPTDLQTVAAWAVRNRLWQPQQSAVISQCADHLARALREEYITDRQGRRVRAKHPAPTYRNGKQLMLWDDIRTASRDHMRAAFQTRRRQIVGDCHQLKTDVDSYNDNYNSGQQIPMIFDFTQDLQELDATIP